MIGVTGASGHLGSVLMEMLPDAEPIGRTMPDRKMDALIHAAAPSFRDTDAVLDFRSFNAEVKTYVDKYQPETVIVTGSWWQHAIGECRNFMYTLLKDEQKRIFDQAVHILPYSIYGEQARQGRGFIPQLILAARGDITLAGLSEQPRDFIHVTDVALAHIRALDAKPGTYTAGTQFVIRPMDLAELFGIGGSALDDHPHAEPQYLADPVPGWEPLMNVVDYLRFVFNPWGWGVHPI